MNKKRENKKMRKNLKITYQTGIKRLQPRIVIQGKWLKELGYIIGDEIVLNTIDDVIIIRRKNSEYCKVIEGTYNLNSQFDYID